MRTTKKLKTKLEKWYSWDHIILDGTHEAAGRYSFPRHDIPLLACPSFPSTAIAECLSTLATFCRHIPFQLLTDVTLFRHPIR